MLPIFWDIESSQPTAGDDHIANNIENSYELRWGSKTQQ